MDTKEKFKPAQPVTRATLVRDVKQMLLNRRWVFFKTYPDRAKQQLIIDAETVICMIQNEGMMSFTQHIHQFADVYVKPLIPREGSPMHNNIEKLYLKLKNFNIK